MNTLNLTDLTLEESIEIDGGFAPLYYAMVAAWGLGVAYGYLTP